MIRRVTIEIDHCYKCPYHDGRTCGPSYCELSNDREIHNMNGRNNQINKDTGFPDWCELIIVDETGKL